jgi:hypothetical protein
MHNAIIGIPPETATAIAIAIANSKNGEKLRAYSPDERGARLIYVETE